MAKTSHIETIKNFMRSNAGGTVHDKELSSLARLSERTLLVLAHAIDHKTKIERNKATSFHE